MDDLSQAAHMTGRCQLLEMPVEILLHIISLIDLEADENGEALPVSLACKTLREACCSRYFQGLEIDVSKPIQLKLLRARADDPSVAPAIRDLRLSSEAETQPVNRSLLDPLLHALEKMSGLDRISLPPWLLVEETLTALRNNPSVLVIDIDGLVNRSTFSLDAFLPSHNSSSSSSAPLRPLTFELELGLDESGFGSDLVARFKQSGDTVVSISVVVDSPIVPPFLVDLLPDLKYLDIELDPASAEVVLPWTSTLPALYPSLEAVSIGIKKEKDGDEEDPTFFLSKSNWIDIPGNEEPAVAEFLGEWSEVAFESVDVDQKMGGGDGAGRDGELSRVAFVLDECIISRSMVVSLGQVVGSVVNLVLEPRYWNASFGWQDWNSTVSAFSAFESLKMLEFCCTFTPSLTLDVVVGCKPECLDLVYTHRPSLKTDLVLVGGKEGLRTLETRLNVARLELLAPHLPVSTEVSWRFGHDDPVAEWSGWVESDEKGEGEGRKTLSMKQVGKRREEWREGSKPACLVCQWHFQEDTEQMTPIDSLVDCPVEEVRAALALGGMDLVAFDSRSLVGNETPFEVFLRSGSASSSS